MRILAFETSCDETGLAIVEGQRSDNGFSFIVHKQLLLSQALLHSPYGGVYPNLAKREHEKNLPALYKEIENEPVDAIAVTVGPGLEPALWTGIEFAKKIAQERGLPLYPINHMEGHLLSSLVENGTIENTTFPVLALLISGGHTEFVVMDKWLSYKVVGATLDDAVGEAFDKVARMLGLPYPGGPHISRAAKEWRESGKSHEWKLPRPMIQTNTCDFSFSGLKTAALYALRDRGGVQNISDEDKQSFAAEFEEAVAEVLVAKARKALEVSGAGTFVIGGGVAANIFIREELSTLIRQECSDVALRLPELSITGDNAVMIGEAALVRALLGAATDASGFPPEILRAVGNLSIAG